MMSAVPETMLGVLAYLDARHGGAERYLRVAGVAEAIWSDCGGVFANKW